MSRILQRIEREMSRPRQRTRAQAWARRLTIGICVIGIPIVGSELALRVLGFHRPHIALEVQARTNESSVGALNSRFDAVAFTPDRYLLWKLKPGTNVGGIAVNQLGTLGPAPADKKNGTIRVLCLGDSITAQTYRTYPHIAQHLMEQGAPDKHTEFINAAVGGYTSEQGLRWLTKLRNLKPDIVIACFGWNDHFPALNLPDKELGARNAVMAAAHRYFRNTRLHQFIAAPSGERHLTQSTDESTESLRVGPAEFDRNLRQFVSSAKSMGAVAVLATQPEHLGNASSAHLSQAKFINGHEPARDLHLSYNAIVRNVAAQTNSPLLDFEEEFDRRHKEHLFEPDGIHFSGPGHNLAARLLIGVLRNHNVISEAEFQKVVNAARYDTTAPDKPHVAWVLEPAQLDLTTTQTAQVSVLAKNTGNSTWLRAHVVPEFGTRRNVRYGGVSIVGSWRTAGAETTGPATQSRLGHDLYPGESTSNTLSINAPSSPGIYAMEISLEADGLGPLKHYGAEVTTLTVSARQP